MTRKARLLLLRYLSQESTWRGLIAVVMAFGVAVDPERVAAIVSAGMTLIGLINICKNK